MDAKEEQRSGSERGFFTLGTLISVAAILLALYFIWGINVIDFLRESETVQETARILLDLISVTWNIFTDALGKTVEFLRGVEEGGAQTLPEGGDGPR